MSKTKGQRRAEDRRAARKQINRHFDPGVKRRIGYGAAHVVSHADREDHRA